MASQFPTLQPGLMERYAQNQQAAQAAVKPTSPPNLTPSPIPSSPPPQGSSNNPHRFPSSKPAFGRIGRRSR